jgi:dsDNA-binding SOS-regulon protein
MDSLPLSARTISIINESRTPHTLATWLNHNGHVELSDAEHEEILAWIATLPEDVARDYLVNILKSTAIVAVASGQRELVQQMTDDLNQELKRVH